MNKFLLFIFCVFSYSSTNMYWDLGVAVSTAPNTIGTENSIDLSTFNRLEGLKKYYNTNFASALIHFEDFHIQPDQISVGSKYPYICHEL